VRYLIVAESYRDLEQLSSRLALTERLAVLRQSFRRRTGSASRCTGRQAASVTSR
jgi:hypothetical protein